MMTVLANFIWPALYLESRILSIPVILIGLIVEIFFVKFIVDSDFWRAIKIAVVMNVASTVIGIILLPVLGLVWEFLAGLLLYEIFNLGSFSIIGWFATLLLAVAINTAIEGIVITKLFAEKIGRRGVISLSIANAVSIAIALVSIFVFPIRS